MLSLLCFIHSLVGSELCSSGLLAVVSPRDILLNMTDIMAAGAEPGHDHDTRGSAQEQLSTPEPHHSLAPDLPASSGDQLAPIPHTASSEDCGGGDPSLRDLHTCCCHDLASLDSYVPIGQHSFDKLSQCGQQMFCDTIPEEQQVKPARTRAQVYRGSWSRTQPPQYLPTPEPCSSGGVSSPVARYTKQGKVSSPGKYRSTTLGRSTRRGRLVITPKPQEVLKERGARSQTEPPPSLATPDLLQVSWVWDTRPMTRCASVRRRPSCRVSCRRRPRPRPARHRASSSSSASRRSHTPAEDVTEAEHDRGFCSGGEMSDNNDAAPREAQVMTPDIIMPDVVVLNKGGGSWPTERTMLSGERCVKAKDGPAPCLDTQQVRLRNKSNSSYLQTVSRSLKHKWRNSDLFCPKLFGESLDSYKSKQASDNRKSILDRAKDFPLQMKKLTCFLFKNGKELKNVDIVVTRDAASRFYLEMEAAKALEDGRRRLPTRQSSAPVSARSSLVVKRQGSFSPRNNLRKVKTLNWNQKYKTVMGRQKESSCAPTILVTAAEEPVVPASQHGGKCVASTPENGDCFAATRDASECDGVRQQQLHPQRQQVGLEDKRQQGGGGVGMLERLLDRLRRPRSLSRSRASSRSSVSGGSEDGQSPPHSSDYEEQEGEGERTGSASLVGRMRGLRRDMQKKISRLKSPRGSTCSSPGPAGSGEKPGASLTAPAHHHPAAASYESIPSSVPLATPAPGSNRSSLSGEEAEPYTGPFIGRARALVDCQPSPYDRDALKFKKGDIIDIIAKNPSGLWKGCVDGRVGHFKFILVEEEVERPARRSRAWRGTTPRRGRARTLEEILTRLHLGHLIQVFVLNGYEDLDQFRDLEKADLDCLGITDPETCAKLLTAVALLHDADSEPEPDPPESLDTTEAALRRGDHGRDSGCYTDHRSTHTTVLDENNLDTRQSTPSTDNSSGYHSRGAYNIPVGEGTQTSRDDPHSSALDSPPSESTTTGAVATVLSTQTESHSYRAHLATVLPASPRSQARHSHAAEQKHRKDPQVDYEAKFVTARSVFEKDSVRREVPFTVRSQKRMGSSHSLTGETEDGVKYDISVAAPELPTP
ncbi:uncharacterized protein [Procambarus clarkii]|uniref:uncharacterized protein isoform X4 n=1 Tax=Procambarus clarkii TaxID=6728 RepID=UPI003744567B